MDYDDSFDKTSDNTKVMRIMSDFQDFMSKQSSSTRHISRPHVSSIPFHLSAEDDEPNISSKCISEASTQKTLNAELKVKIKRMESDHLSEKKALMQENIQLEALYEKRNAEIFQLQERCDVLRLKNKQITEQNLDMVDRIKSAEEQRDKDIKKWETSFQKLEKLKEEGFQRVQTELSNQQARVENLLEENMTLKSQLNNASLHLEEAYANMELFKERADEGREALLELPKINSELFKAKQQIHQLSESLSQAEDAEKTVKFFKQDMNRLRLLETQHKKLTEEIAILRENRENNMLLSEKLKLAEAQLDRARTECSKFYELEAINQSLTSKLQDMENMQAHMREEDEIKSRAQVVELNHLAERLHDKTKVLESEYNLVQSKLAAESDTVSRLKQKISDLEESSTSVNAQLSRLRKRASLLAQERNSIRAILQSYDAELTMTSHTTQLSKRLVNEEESNAKLHARIEQLENELQKNIEESMRQRLLIKKLEGNSGKVKNVTDASTDPSEESSFKEILDLKRQVDEYKKERAVLLDKIGDLKAWIEQGKIKGDYNPDSTKVLHFTMNPADLAHQKSKQDLADLKEENSKLKKKIREMQEGHEISVSEFEVPQKIRDELSMSELRNQRLKEVFSKKIQEFRQACYSLTGFRIDTSKDSKFKLVSMYADSQSDYLLFEMSSDGEMQLLETEYSKSLQELISLHLHHQNSIPMFLSALSVNLFSQQTMIE